MNDVNKLINLNFIGRSRSGGGHKTMADVSISKTKDGFSFVFRNGVHDLFDGDNLMFAINNDCVFFKADPRGWKMFSNEKASPNRYIKIKNGPDLSEFIGDYELKHFEALDLYYVERSES